MHRLSLITCAAMSGALVLGATPNAAVAKPGSDPVPSVQAATWLADELQDNLLFETDDPPADDRLGYVEWDDSVDAALAAAEVGNDTLAQRLAHGFAPLVASGYAIFDDRELARSKAGANPVYETPGYSAWGFARSLVLAEVAGHDPRTYGGVDLVAGLERLVSTTAPTVGKVLDQRIQYFGPESVAAEAFAARGLSAVGSPKAEDVIGFLLQQQCAAGYFRRSLTRDAGPAQSCDAASGEPDVDTTAQAVLELGAITPTTPKVEQAIADARAWLLSQQGSMGAWAGFGDWSPRVWETEPRVNSFSTALAARALDDAAASQRAAAWVRRRQVRDAGPCTTRLTSARGAVAWSDSNWSDGLRHGIGVEAHPHGVLLDNLDRWHGATAVAMPTLRHAPGPVGSLAVSWPAGRYLGVGGRPGIRFSGLAPYAAACASGAGRGQAYAGVSGSGSVSFTVASLTGRRTVTVTDSDGRHVSRAYTVLGRKKLRMHASQRSVHRGGREHVTVSGLAAYEHLTVRVDGHVVEHGVAGPHGVYQTSVGVGRRVGTHHVHVTGASWYRSAKITFHVKR